MSDDLKKLHRRFGSAEKVDEFVKILAQEKHFFNAISSSIGKELLDDAQAILSQKVEAVLLEEDNQDIRAEIRVLRLIISRWSQKINKYLRDQQKFNSITQG